MMSLPFGGTHCSRPTSSCSNYSAKTTVTARPNKNRFSTFFKTFSSIGFNISSRYHHDPPSPTSDSDDEDDEDDDSFPSSPTTIGFHYDTLRAYSPHPHSNNNSSSHLPAHGRRCASAAGSYFPSQSAISFRTFTSNTAGAPSSSSSSPAASRRQSKSRPTSSASNIYMMKEALTKRISRRASVAPPSASSSSSTTPTAPRTPVNSATHLPGTTAPPPSPTIGKKLLTKIPNVLAAGKRASRSGMEAVVRPLKRPSTLDFRCVGTILEEEAAFEESGGWDGNKRSGGVWEGFYPCAPRIPWAKPDIHSDWKKDWFTHVC